MNSSFVVLVLVTVTAGGVLIYSDQQRRILQEELAVTRQSYSARENTARVMEEKLNQLSQVLTQSTAQLRLANLKLEAYEAKQQADVEAAQRNAARSADLKKAMAAVPAPVVETSLNSLGREIRHYTFPQLLGAKSEVLATNATYSSAFGQRLVFRPVTGSPLAFDVDELHPGVLAYLGLDADTLKQAQVELDQRRQAQEAAYRKDLALRQAAEQKAAAEQARLNVEYAKLREEQRQAQVAEDQKNRQLDNDRLRAEAAMRSADAALQDALRPDYIVQPVYVIPRRTPSQPNPHPFTPPSTSVTVSNSPGRTVF